MLLGRGRGGGGGSNCTACVTGSSSVVRLKVVTVYGPLVVDPHTDWSLVTVGCLTSQQHASVSQGRICSDNFTGCHAEIEAADQTFFLTQSQYTDTGPTSPSADPIMIGAWQGSHWSVNFSVIGETRPGKIPSLAGIQPGIFLSRGARLNH